MRSTTPLRRLVLAGALTLALLPALPAGPARAASALAPAGPATTLTVCPSGPPTCEYTQIQAAINAASAGATITIAAGTYTETLTIPLSLTVQGAGVGRTIVDGHHSGSVVMVNSGATVAIHGVTIQNGSATNGSGIYNVGTLTLTNSAVSANFAGGCCGSGGGIFNAGTLYVTNSTIMRNTASGTGSGGGIDNEGTLTLINSTVSGNSAYVGSGIANGGTLALTNSTVAGNSASDNGGGIYSFGTLRITNSTISSNSAQSSYGHGGGINNAGTLLLINTILAGNTAGIGPDCVGTLTSGGDNLVGIGDGCGLTNGLNGDQVGSSTSPLNPLLGPLQDNGGPTQTMAPLLTSAAIDVVPPWACTVRTDQRGQSRPDGGDRGECDSGAVETAYGGAQPPQVTGMAPSTGLYTGGTSVVIAGANLVGPALTATVRFGGVAAQAINPDPSGTRITATSPATSGVGTVDVTVQTSRGTSPLTSSDRYTYMSAGTLYVATTGSDTNGCVTPASPCRTIGHAIVGAASGAALRVAGGMYTETVTIPVSLTLLGAGADRTIVDGNQSGTVVAVNIGATVAISGVSIQNGSASGIGEGGGINNAGTLALTNSTVSGNAAMSNIGAGGGIYNFGTLRVANSTVSSNNAFSDGGGIANGSTLTLINSTVSGNSAGEAGGIYNFGTVTVTNSTVSGNSAIGAQGGGIFNSGTVTVTNSSISDNSAPFSEAGGIFNNDGDPVTLADTILAGNTASSNPDCVGTLTSGGYNLIGIGDGCGLTNGVNGDQVGSSASPLNPLLGPLQGNGGPTQTMAELPGSPAIDVVPLAHCPLSSDQRGQPRPDPGDSAVCDAGAFELQD